VFRDFELEGKLNVGDSWELVKEELTLPHLCCLLLCVLVSLLERTELPCKDLEEIASAAAASWTDSSTGSTSSPEVPAGRSCLPLPALSLLI
jgi:hypothetical protein